MVDLYVGFRTCRSWMTVIEEPVPCIFVKRDPRETYMRHSHEEYINGHATSDPRHLRKDGGQSIRLDDDMMP